jgi:hypothetical protein
VRPLSRCRRRSFVPPNATSNAITVRAVGFGSSALRGVIDAVRKRVSPGSGKVVSSVAAPSNDAEWQFFRRIGTVVAEQRDEAWTWTLRSGQTMQANAGDWSVQDTTSGHTWSVREDIFRTRYDHIGGRIWRRRGMVRARPARDGEVVDTLEGRVTTSPGDWLVLGEHGDRWPVPGDDFAQRYDGPVRD